MKGFWAKPYAWFLLATPFVYLACILYARNLNNHNQLYDAPISFTPFQYFIIPLILFLLWSGIHNMTHSNPDYRPKLSYSFIHFFITAVLCPCLMVGYSFFVSTLGGGYHLDTFEDYKQWAKLDLLYAIFGLFIATQVVFFTYICWLVVRSIVRNRK